MLTRLITIFGVWLHLTSVIAQCNGTQSATLTPPPPAGGYAPNTTVTVCYTMQNWLGTNVGSNWLEGFDINLGAGWSSPTPQAPPINCQGGGGTWLWMNTVTSSVTGITTGPGWFFESPSGGPTDGNPGNDWGDYGTSCSWSFCFTITTLNVCNPLNLLIQVTPYADGTMGSWTNNSCPQTPYTIYDGNINPQLPSIGNITHN